MTSSSSILPCIPIQNQPGTPLEQQAVRQLALNAGFTEAGIVALPHGQTEVDAARFAQFVDQGRSGTMNYLARRNDQGELIRSRVAVPFAWAQSAIVCLASYHADAPLSTQAADHRNGWIARYAWSGIADRTANASDSKRVIRPSDYHKVLLKRLHALESQLRQAYGDFESRAYVDTGPVVERSLARAAGVGWTGKNTCLIHPKLGSFNFLAVLITSLPVASETVPLTIPDRCGSCRRCIDACPTGALDQPYRMDATRCISYLTIEYKGDEIADELKSQMGRQVVGCDICQDVCPWNRKAPIGHDPELYPRAELINPSLDWLAALTEADFERLFNGSPVRRASFASLRRNVAIAMGNSGLVEFLPALERMATEAAHQGAAQLAQGAAGLRDAARWAISRLKNS